MCSPLTLDEVDNFSGHAEKKVLKVKLLEIHPCKKKEIYY